MIIQYIFNNKWVSLMSHYTTFNINDMVFIENIGYGTMMQCGGSTSLSIKDLPMNMQKRQSIYFDPELFNSEPDSFGRNKSQQAVLVTDLDKQKQVQPPKQAEKPSQSPTQQSKQQSQSQTSVEQTEKHEQEQQREMKPFEPIQPKLHIVRVKLQGTNAFVYTLDTHLRKHVIVPVRPLFLPAIGFINIKIQIGKTIESFKRQIFELLGLKHSHYFNIKLYTTTPYLTELSVPSKTIWQYGIKQSSKLTMTAQHGFCFESIPANLTESFSVTSNNLTFVSLPRKPKQATQNAVIALPPPPTQPVTTQTPTQTTANEAKVQEKQQKTQASVPAPAPIDGSTPVENKTEQKKSQTAEKQSTKMQQELKPPAIVQVEPPETLQIKGDKYMKSGRQYFEVRLDKLPQNNSHLKIIIYEIGSERKWYFLPMTMQKIHVVGKQTKSTQNYGMPVKQNDIIGVLATIDKHKNMKITYFKNSVNLGVCFQAKIEQICFGFCIGNEGQISLDTRAQPPIDSYRLR